LSPYEWYAFRRTGNISYTQPGQGVSSYSS
jgi:hypothetical protein